MRNAPPGILAIPGTERRSPGARFSHPPGPAVRVWLEPLSFAADRSAAEGGAMSANDLPAQRPSDSGSQARRVTTYDAKDPGDGVPADRAAAAADGRAERPGRPDRRRRLRRLERLRRAVRHADLRAARGGRAQVQPLPHHRAVLADPRGAAHRPQPPLGRHGRDHRDRDLRARLQLGPARTRARRWPRRSS